jgi:putative membrane protein
MYGYTGMGWGMIFGWILGIAALIVIIWLIVKAVNYSNHSQNDDDKSALDVLKKRFAEGEISREEYEEMKKIIES